MPRHRLHYEVVTDQTPSGWWSARLVVTCAELPEEIIYAPEGKFPGELEAIADLRTAIADLTRMGLNGADVHFPGRPHF